MRSDVYVHHLIPLVHICVNQRVMVNNSVAEYQTVNRALKVSNSFPKVLFNLVRLFEVKLHNFKVASQFDLRVLEDLIELVWILHEQKNIRT